MCSTLARGSSLAVEGETEVLAECLSQEHACACVLMGGWVGEGRKGLEHVEFGTHFKINRVEEALLRTRHVGIDFWINSEVKVRKCMPSVTFPFGSIVFNAFASIESQTNAELLQMVDRQKRGERKNKKGGGGKEGGRGV